MEDTGRRSKEGWSVKPGHLFLRVSKMPLNSLDSVNTQDVLVSDDPNVPYDLKKILTNEHPFLELFI